MQNIFDYLEWRGDLSFAQDGLNEIDNLIFSILAYLELDNIVPYEPCNKSITIKKLSSRNCEQLSKFSEIDYNPFLRQIPVLLHKTAQTARFGGIKLSRYVNVIDEACAEQFSAVVFSINPELHFIAFRGTDDTLVGWKENFRMSFLDEIPAQKHAVGYMINASACLRGNFYLGGHSKGGNLAVYAATHAGNNLRQRIIAAYNNDGPGFQSKVLNSDGYQSMFGKLHTLIPKSSVVGMLLEHAGDYKVISSNEIGIMQHNAFSWEVHGANFVREQGLTRSSLTLNHTVRLWLDQMTIEERSEFVDSLFDGIQATGARTVSDLTHDKLAIAFSMFKTYTHLDKQTRTHLRKAVELLFHESRKSLGTTLRNDWSNLFSRRKKQDSPAKPLELKEGV
ncbi:MAG: DUF2974 domain-containing protein [Dehalococcoidia bacterium]|nr:DUF2974 domain-containing protein [Dehalococcoidia bacterium]